MLAKLFGSRPKCLYVAPQHDLSILDDGLNKLQQTAAEVSAAAVSVSKQLEDEHRRTKACFIALNSASDGICILDSRGCIFFCNDQFITTQKLPSYKDVVGKHILDIFPNIPNYDRVWSSVKSNHTEVFTCLANTVTIVPMMNGEPEPIYYVCTFKKINTSATSEE